MKICRSPCGERGLKCVLTACLFLLIMSLPVRGAWIEMSGSVSGASITAVAPRAGSVD